MWSNTRMDYCTAHVSLDVTGYSQLFCSPTVTSKSKAMITSFRSFKTGHQHEKNRVVIPNMYSQRLQTCHSSFLPPLFDIYVLYIRKLCSFIPFSIWYMYFAISVAIPKLPYLVLGLPDTNCLYCTGTKNTVLTRCSFAKKKQKKERLDSVSRKDIKNSVIGGWGRGCSNRHER